MSSSSSDDNDDDVSSTLSDDDEHKKKAPITLTDQGLVNMVSNCLENVSDEIQVNAVISCYMYMK